MDLEREGEGEEPWSKIILGQMNMCLPVKARETKLAEPPILMDQTDELTASEHIWCLLWAAFPKIDELSTIVE